MQADTGPFFTPAEAAALTRMTVRAVNHAIDKKTVPALTHTTHRLLGLPALMMLQLERRLSGRFVPELRRQVFAALGKSRIDAVSLDNGFLRIDLDQPRRELATALRQLRRARQLVASDPEILGGDPVFRGTRIPVHSIAAQIEAGATSRELLEGYPRLTIEMVQLASIYAVAYPMRGRPRPQPWHTRPPRPLTRQRLANPPAQ